MKEPEEDFEQLLGEQGTHRDHNTDGDEDIVDERDGKQVDQPRSDGVGKRVAEEFELLQNEGTGIGCVGSVLARGRKPGMRGVLLTDNGGFHRRRLRMCCARGQENMHVGQRLLDEDIGFEVSGIADAAGRAVM